MLDEEYFFINCSLNVRSFDQMKQTLTGKNVELMDFVRRRSLCTKLNS